MTTLIQILLLLLCVPLALFGIYQLLLVLFSVVRLMTHQPVKPVPTSEHKRFVVLVPAHDEELLIGNTVESILAADYPRERFQLVVIADNCSDKTAEIARSRGATCLERADTTRRGKPYALDWAIKQLDLNAYDALVIIDADTAIHRDFFSVMNVHLQRGQQALQGYFGVMNPDQNWLTRLALLPGTLKFKLHFPGKELLGLSCPLAGNGMCFDIALIKRYGWNAFSITENWEYWVLLTLEGVRVDPAPQAVIYSQVAKSLSSGESQRLRWMRGRMQVLLTYGGTLLKRGFLQADAMKVDAVLELAKPSHAMYVAWSVGYLGLTGAFALYDAAFLPAFWVAVTILSAQILTLLVAFALDRPPLRTWLALLMVPWYVMWKLALSVRGVLTLRDRAWVRTKRHNPADARPE